MKKIILFSLMFLFLFTGCGKKNDILPEETIIESTINKVNTAKKETAKQTTINIKKTAEIYYLELQLINEIVENDIIIDFSDTTSIPENFVFNGFNPTSGMVIIDNAGNITLKDLVINGVTCNINENDDVVCN